ncbi:MAG: glycosyltransferase family 4 protein [Curvibacter sp.]|jgi:glycosyltransferase involved in cell wall biosynthesis|nr:glycosyltransferase family 1 protein [Curvibacter sp.]
MKPDTTDLLVEDLPAAQTHLRIAVVTETYPPEVNGVALTLQRVVQGLRELGHHVQLVRPRQAADAASPASGQDVLMRGMAIPRYPHLQLGLPSRRQLQPLWTLHRPDLVHIATEGPLGWSALRVARKLRIPVTSDFRTNFHAYSSHYGMGWLSKPIMAYLRRFHNQTLTTMVPTRGLAERLTAAGFERLQVVARGVDLGVFNPALRDEALRVSWGASPATPVLMCVGRLAKEKNLPLLVRAYAQARLQRPDLKLVLVGDGPQRAELQALAPDAIFTGQLDRQDLARHYASADIFGFPSQTETFGNVVLEAMASGLAVVAYDYAAASENIEHGQTGLLVPMDDETTFVRELVALAQSDTQCAALRANARGAARACDWSGIVVQIETVMKMAVAAQGATPPQALPLAAQQVA